MSINLDWHLQCPLDRSDEALGIINKFLEASAGHRIDFEKSNRSSLRVSFNQSSLTDKETKRPLNARAFDKAVQGIKQELANAFGDQASFYPITGGYNLPRAL